MRREKKNQTTRKHDGRVEQDNSIIYTHILQRTREIKEGEREREREKEKKGLNTIINSMLFWGFQFAITKVSFFSSFLAFIASGDG